MRRTNLVTSLVIACLTLPMSTTPPAYAQDPGQLPPRQCDPRLVTPEGSTSESPSTADNDTSVWKIELGCLSSGKVSRFWRSFTINLSAIDQPDNIIIARQSDLGNMEVDPVASFANPDDTLYQLKVDFKPEQWFKTTAELGAAYSSAKALAKAGLLTVETDPTGDLVDKLRYFLRARPEDVWKRRLSAFSFSVAVSERARVSGTAIVDPIAFNRDKRDFTGSLTFDPDKWIFFPDRASAAYNALDDYAGVHKAMTGLEDPQEPCGQDSWPIDCLETLSGIKRIKGRWIAALIPTVSWERKDQFDFFQSGTNFIPTPLLEDSIDTLKVTWDLSSTLDTSVHRRAALAAIAKHHAIRKREKDLEAGPQIVIPDLGKLSVHEVVIHQMTAKKTVGKVSWKLEKGAYQGFKVSKAGLLYGSPRQTGRIRLKVEACDSWGKLGKCNSKELELVTG